MYGELFWLEEIKTLAFAGQLLTNLSFFFIWMDLANWLLCN
ncbi:hypothetical protein RintRC_1568 [Richelia intracellularis]|nr:hypothetical protein RintRC_1568 [Richelia intracellularis]